MEAEENGNGEEVGLLVLEAKSLRPFKTKDEYLYAMKEDLAEWFKCLYEDILINAENFLEVLETGVLLCQHANEVRKFAAEQKEKGAFQMKSNFVRDIQIPQYEVQFRVDVKPETFLARDNVSNFITWTVKMGIPEVLRFETDDLVLRKNERSVVLCLLEVARVGAKFGMLAPTIVQMEEEIDEEIATGEPPPQIKTCDIKSLDEMVRELVGRCTCPVQFPIIKVGEGKYKIGDSQTLVFVRILRKHVMIRVGGGWDTLEHYLDRHDPCRCNFQGHRQGGRGPTTPRRSSVSAASQSLPNTPRTQRKLSIASPATPQAQTNQGNSNIRSASPGPNSKKLPLSRTNSQPDTAITSPGVSVKSPNFSSSGTNFGISKNSVSNVSVSKSRPSNQTSNLSGNVKSGSVSGPINQRRSASPAPGVRRSQSPAPNLRRSQSPAPEAINRLRSPSPAPSSSKTNQGTRTQSVPASAAKRCASPVKQITMSELRSSREGKPGLFRRQASVESSGNDVNGDIMDAKSENKTSDTNLTIDKISTMSLGEFKNLLNSALSVPNGTESQCSSESPRSQSSVDSFRNNQIPLNKKGPTNKSASGYRPGSANRNISNVSKTNSLPRTKSSSLDCSSSGYSTSSVSSDKSKKSPSNTSSPSSTYARTSGVRPKTPSGDLSNAQTSRSLASRSNLSNKHNAYSSVGQAGSVTSQLRPQNSAYKTRSQTSLDSDGASVKLQNVSTVPSRSSSQSSFKSYDSFNELDTYATDGLRRVETDSCLPRNAELESSGHGYYGGSVNSSQTSPVYLRSNSYTPCASAEEKAKWAEPRTELRANSEPKEVNKGDSNADEQPLNVGYASFSHSERNDFNDSYKFDEELNKIETELKKFENRKDDINGETYSSADNRSSVKESNTNIQQPVRRPSTPSLIPRPATPKMSRKLSIPTSDEKCTADKQIENRGRPPTPKKSNIIARAQSASSTVRAADSSKEKSYKDIFQAKRSTTPGPGNVSSTPSKDLGRRCTTPGPSMSRTTSLSTTSATTTRARLNQTLEQNRDTGLSLSDKKKSENQNNRTRTTSQSSAGTANVRAQSFDSRSLVRQNATEQPETVIMVNRSDTGHSLKVQEHAQPKTNANKPAVLARARTEDARSRTQTRTNMGISRQRPQSVEPRQLISRSRKSSESNADTEVLSVCRNENGQHEVYDRTQEWVQTAAEQTSKVQKTKIMKQVNPKVRRAMTPNSFDKRIDQDEEPRSFEEIKAALTLPINGLTRIEVDTENLDAPPEDPEMYATMEKLFNELRKQELKASVNETPGSSSMPSRSSKSKSKSSSSMNDEEASLDSNKNIKQKKFSLSSKSSSGISSPSVPQKKTSLGSTSSQAPIARQPSRTSSVSSVSAHSSAPLSTQPSTPRTTPPRATPPRTTSTQRSSDPPRPASPSMNRSFQPPRPASPRTTAPPPQSKPPAQRPASPRTISNPPRPASPKTFQSPVPASPRNSQPTVAAPQRNSQQGVPPSPRNTPSSKSTTPRTTQPVRPASTPPRPSTPVGRKSSSKLCEDNDDVFVKEKENAVAATSLISKIKEIIKVKPRKDKAEGVKQKSKIPAPKSLASAGKSRSFTNLSSVKSMTLPNTKSNGRIDYPLGDSELNGTAYENEINGGLNATLSGRSETPKLKMAMPLTTGRATVIRKESMERNKNPPKLLRAVSVERNMGGLNNNFQFYEDGEYV